MFFFSKWVVEPLPREAALAADLITAALIRLLVVPGQYQLCGTSPCSWGEGEQKEKDKPILTA